MGETGEPTEPVLLSCQSEDDVLPVICGNDVDDDIGVPVCFEDAAIGVIELVIGECCSGLIIIGDLNDEFGEVLLLVSLSAGDLLTVFFIGDIGDLLELLSGDL